jgi:hypothetical protein
METSKLSPNVNNLAMPRGALSFAPFDDSGNSTGEIDLGNVASLELTNAIKYKDHMTSHDSVVVLDAKKPSEQQFTIKFTPEERSAENMALFLLGDPDANKTGGTYQAPGFVDRQAITKTYLDRWLDLGKKYIKPGSIKIYKNNTGTVILLRDLVDINGNPSYRIDYENGLIMFLSTDVAVSFTDGMSGNTISFHWGKATLKGFKTRIRPMVGFLRYRGLSEQGPRHSIECWKVQITPDAALGFIKPQDYAGLGFSGDVFIDDDTNSHRATDPFFKVTELSSATAYPS